MIRNFYSVLRLLKPPLRHFFQRSAPSVLLSKSENPFPSRTREDHPAGVVDTAPTQSLVLLLDFKTSGEALWPYVQSALLPFFCHTRREAWRLCETRVCATKLRPIRPFPGESCFFKIALPWNKSRNGTS